MVATVFATGPTEPEPIPDPVDDRYYDPYAHLREAASSIVRRVRRVLVPPDFTPLRVLVVDDHPDAAESLAAVLDLLGCPVYACHDGWSALAAAPEFLPQVCLIDLMMPGMDGIELASRLKVWAGNRPLLVVATTALGDEEVKARTAIAGFHEHLVKPIDAATLIQSLTRLGRVLARTQSDGPARYLPTDTPLDGEEELGHS